MARGFNFYAGAPALDLQTEVYESRMSCEKDWLASGADKEGKKVYEVSGSMIKTVSNGEKFIISVDDFRGLI